MVEVFIFVAPRGAEYVQSVQKPNILGIQATSSYQPKLGHSHPKLSLLFQNINIAFVTDKWRTNKQNRHDANAQIIVNRAWVAKASTFAMFKIAFGFFPSGRFLSTKLVSCTENVDCAASLIEGTTDPDKFCPIRVS